MDVNEDERPLMTSFLTLKCRIVIKALQSSGHFTFNLEWVMPIVENLTVTLKCRIVIKALQSSGHFTFNLEWVMPIVENLTVTEKYRLVIKVLY
jgi:hypothetical protein